MAGKAINRRGNTQKRTEQPSLSSIEAPVIRHDLNEVVYSLHLIYPHLKSMPEAVAQVALENVTETPNVRTDEPAAKVVEISSHPDYQYQVPENNPIQAAAARQAMQAVYDQAPPDRGTEHVQKAA